MIKTGLIVAGITKDFFQVAKANRNQQEPVYYYTGFLFFSIVYFRLNAQKPGSFNKAFGSLLNFALSASGNKY